ncbi:MAG: PfkB family carbohydrate kinase [Candidatus Bathyarchaeota archaeon]|nr:PfkB family carbohydrate kinase [Candidatus Bathyarchaeota archaeon]
MIVNLGSVALDTTETPFKSGSRLVGGSGTYSSIAASFFAESGLIGIIGDDFPEEYINLFREKLDLAGLVIGEGKSFHFVSSFGYDLGARTTIATELNVFGDWDPIVPEEYRNAEFLYLGNVGPHQQLSVLEQVDRPRLTVADTIEYWINTDRAGLIEVISRVNGMVLNDNEVRQLCQTSNLIMGAKEILDWGPRFVIVKKGEHGAILFTRKKIFPTCGYPLEKIRDPTGAGDCFAGGFMGHLARSGSLNEPAMREAVVYGNVMGSFAVEEFSINRFIPLTIKDIERRYNFYKSMVSF